MQKTYFSRFKESICYSFKQNSKSFFLLHFSIQFQRNNSISRKIQLGEEKKFTNQNHLLSLYFTKPLLFSINSNQYFSLSSTSKPFQRFKITLHHSHMKRDKIIIFFNTDIVQNSTNQNLLFSLADSTAKFN